MQIEINKFDRAGYGPNLFEDEPFNIFSSIDMISSKVQPNNCYDPFFHQET